MMAYWKVVQMVGKKVVCLDELMVAMTVELMV